MQDINWTWLLRHMKDKQPSFFMKKSISVYGPNRKRVYQLKKVLLYVEEANIPVLIAFMFKNDWEARFPSQFIPFQSSTILQYILRSWCFQPSQVWWPLKEWAVTFLVWGKPSSKYSNTLPGQLPKENCSEHAQRWCHTHIMNILFPKITANLHQLKKN